MKHLLSHLLLLLLALLLCGSAQAEADVDPKDHPLSADRLRGSCQLFRGEIELAVVMVSTPDAPWYSMDSSALRSVVRSAIDDLESDAASYGVRLSISPRYYQATGSDNPDEEDWELTVLSTVPDLATRSTTDWFNQPILFCLNADGRSYAITTWLRNSLEYVVYYLDYDPDTIRHELLHLFGAEDFYYHPDVEAAAAAFQNGSIMLTTNTSASIDPFTAWLIGWTATPDEEALAFLRATAHLSADDLEDARAADQRTGTGMFTMEDGVFYGTLEMGCPDGPGYYLWSDNSRYLGDWVWNSREGKGYFSWPDGSAYIGDYANDTRSGKGVYTWDDGDSYAGDFVNGKRTGTGVFTWASGSTYAGSFVDSLMTGPGVLAWTDGTTYAGSFVDGEMSGTGIYTWSDGTSYTGEITDGRLTGRGMLLYPNGDMYIGEVVDGKPHGMGTQYFGDGSTRQGAWSHGVFADK